jgi:antitoxin component YwqK of YwqJK toxin-antitoxin module
MLRKLPVFLPMRFLRPHIFLALLLLGSIGACSKKTVSFNSRPESGVATLMADTLVTNRDTTSAPSLEAKKLGLTKEQEKAAKDKEKLAQRQARKKKKNIFLGERIKKGSTKSGRKGKKQIIEVFYYLKTFRQPGTYATTVYYFNPRKRKIFRANTELDPATDKVLHGPYKKTQGGKVIETGYFALGTKHLRWEKLTGDNVLVSKAHYEMGFPRDANVTYYDAEQKRVKEVVPYVNGKLEGDYVRYQENGQRDWDGSFENGKKVGEWTKYWGFRNRRHYVYQYGESGYDPEVTEPVLVKEYNRNGVLVYEKDKFDRRDAVTDRPGNTRSGGRRN